MKKITIMLFATVTLSSLTVKQTTAQVAANFSRPLDARIILMPSANNNPAPTGSSSTIDKNAVKEMKANLRAAKTQLKISNDFAKRFKNVTDATWYTEEKVAVANFKNRDQATRVVYDKKGNWIYTIVTYSDEELMPEQVRKLVHANYVDFNIKMVQEINQRNIIIYAVQIEDGRHFKQILVYNEEITDYKEFTQSK